MSCTCPYYKGKVKLLIYLRAVLIEIFTAKINKQTNKITLCQSEGGVLSPIILVAKIRGKKDKAGTEMVSFENTFPNS